MGPMFLAWLHLDRGEQEDAIRCVHAALEAKDPWVGLHHLFAVNLVTTTPAFEEALGIAKPTEHG